jgi:NAD(P)-dependent dehydrogenase (short-subunit alcohol dehydrogenase family)
MDGTTAVVTGASRGIGAAIAEQFVAEGTAVLACAREEDGLSALVERVREGEPSGELTTQRADVRDEYDAERLLELAARIGGTIDLVVANAGVYHGTAGETPLAEEPYAAYDDHLRTNGRGVYATIREAVPHLADDARVLVPSGQVAREAQPGVGSYAVSKAAAEAIARGFAVELDPPVGIVDPGQVETDLSGGAGRDPEEVAEMFVWAARELDGEELNGAVVDLKTWRRATR